MSEGRFIGRVAAVLGGGSGMGAAISRRLAAEGAHVYVTDLDEAAACTVRDQVRNEGGSATSRCVDAVSVGTRGTGGTPTQTVLARRYFVSRRHRRTSAIPHTHKRRVSVRR